MTRWTGVADLRSRLLKVWASGRLLAAPLLGQTLFPLRLPLKTPSPQELGEQFGPAKAWSGELARHAQAGGYGLEWQEIKHRQLGKNRVPVAAVFAQEADALRFIGKHKEAKAFRSLCRETLAVFPGLQPWLAKHPLAALERASQWPRLLAILRWLADHPRPQIYLRQLEIAEVDTKFIESNKKILAELLEIILPPAAVDASASGVAGFEPRYGFLAKPVQIRFRLLDAALAIYGLRDLQILAADFAGLNLPVRRVFITENEINGLVFPDLADSLVIFGLGYGLDRLAQAAWLQDKEIYYWGDIDTHGFAMLDQVRRYFPQTRSWLMDRGTLMAHQALWGREPAPASRALTRLGPEEAALYEDLKAHRLAKSLRLEQERVSFAHVRAALRELQAHAFAAGEEG